MVSVSTSALALLMRSRRSPRSLRSSSSWRTFVVRPGMLGSSPNLRRLSMKPRPTFLFREMEAWARGPGPYTLWYVWYLSGRMQRNLVTDCMQLSTMPNRRLILSVYLIWVRSRFCRNPIVLLQDARLCLPCHVWSTSSSCCRRVLEEKSSSVLNKYCII